MKYTLKDLFSLVGSVCLLLGCLVFWFSSRGVVDVTKEISSGFAMGWKLELQFDDYAMGHRRIAIRPATPYGLSYKETPSLLTSKWCGFGGILGFMARIVVQAATIVGSLCLIGFYGWRILRRTASRLSGDDS